MGEFRLRADGDDHATPAGSPCPECGRPVGGMQHFRAAYLSGGAVLMSADGRFGHASDRLRAFLSFGTLDSRARAPGPDVVVVEGLVGGQFALQWCSVGCMRGWLLRLLAEVERAAGEAPDAEPGSVLSSGES